MILILSLAVAILFTAGAYLMLKHDLIRLVIGMVLIGNAANLFIMSAGLQRGDAPIYPLEDEVSDPLVQAMTLTAIVISFAVSALVLSLAYRVYMSHSSVDMRELSQAEEEQAELDDRSDEEPPEDPKRDDNPDTGTDQLEDELQTEEATRP
ncbi:MAG TPA: sodium:proton antiporter [Thermomicrobiales bacterium]|nr:sodium:proton antiporter [Thermomicrobiales bacterium]